METTVLGRRSTTTPSVSEGLNSVETSELELLTVTFDNEFQKDLIVWKHFSGYGEGWMCKVSEGLNSVETNLTPDLPHYFTRVSEGLNSVETPCRPPSSLSSEFQKDLIVWKPIEG